MKDRMRYTFLIHGVGRARVGADRTRPKGHLVWHCFRVVVMAADWATAKEWVPYWYLFKLPPPPLVIPPLRYDCPHTPPAGLGWTLPKMAVSPPPRGDCKGMGYKGAVRGRY